MSKLPVMEQVHQDEQRIYDTIPQNSVRPDSSKSSKQSIAWWNHKKTTELRLLQHSSLLTVHFRFCLVHMVIFIAFLYYHIKCIN